MIHLQLVLNQDSYKTGRLVKFDQYDVYNLVERILVHIDKYLYQYNVLFHDILSDRKNDTQNSLKIHNFVHNNRVHMYIG